jgi:hypothetical protein
MEPFADSGVVAVEMPKPELPKAGTGGISTRRSGDLAFTGLVAAEVGSASVAGALAIVGDVEGASGMTVSAFLEIPTMAATCCFSVSTGEVGDVFDSTLAESRSIGNAPSGATEDDWDFLLSSSPTRC